MARRTVSAKELAYYRANFREAIREDGVVCLECGGIFGLLGPSHLQRHGLSADAYRERWGYNRGTALISGAVHERQRQHALRRQFHLLGPPTALQKAREAWLGSRHPRRPEGRLQQADAHKARVAAGWTPEPKKLSTDTLRALVAENLTARQIAARTGVHEKTVWERVRALGLTVPSFPADQGRVSNAELLALRRAGLRSGEIAARTGMTAAAVHARLRKLKQRGIEVPTPPAPGRKLTDEELLALHQAGLSRREIAERAGLKNKTIYNQLSSLRRRGMIGPATPGRRRVSNDELLALAREGLWSSEIAAQTGMTVGGVHARLARLRRRGVAVPPPTGPVPSGRRRVTDEQLLGYIQAGLRPAEIAARVGIERDSVTRKLRALRKRGLLPPAPARGKAQWQSSAPPPDPS